MASVIALALAFLFAPLSFVFLPALVPLYLAGRQSRKIPPTVKPAATLPAAWARIAMSARTGN
jgi:hypothetical protein